ncbi:MAG: DsbE family thiol:disulfide interchange protein [Thiomicrospira sp.]|jgi:cytochrome c biogenesis protein CcmG/thiol:disulfide interchange protein DsbE|nr:DsbE family thiol:disulfide interchange protein [Thiomicrospira sp.]
MTRSAWPFIGFVLLVLLFSIGLMLNPREVPSPLLNQPAPSLQGNVLGSSELFDGHAYTNQVWLLNVWASWCSGCLSEHPHIVAAKQRYPDMTWIGLNYKDSATPAQAWLAQHGNPYQTVIEDPSGRLGLDWGILGVPETFLIDAQGRVRAKWQGVISEARLQQEIIPAWQALNAETER